LTSIHCPIWSGTNTGAGVVGAFDGIRVGILDIGRLVGFFDGVFEGFTVTGVTNIGILASDGPFSGMSAIGADKDGAVPGATGVGTANGAVTSGVGADGNHIGAVEGYVFG
jgi:hypothetical protein